MLKLPSLGQVSRDDKIEFLTRPLLGSALFLGYYVLVGAQPVGEVLLPTAVFGGTQMGVDATMRFGVPWVMEKMGLVAKADEKLEKALTTSVGEALGVGLLFPLLNNAITRTSGNFRPQAYFGATIALASGTLNDGLNALLA